MLPIKYTKLKEALVFCGNDAIVVAEDIVLANGAKANGAKVFYTDTLENLNQLYQSLENKHWYENLKENCPSRLFLDIESEVSVVDITKLVNIVDENLRKFLRCKGSPIIPVFEVMDSSDSTKSSYHVICTNVYFVNVYHVGSFVRRLVCGMILRGTDSSMIDTSVYTKNRMFRVKGSTKFGSQRVLKHEKSWMSLLVQYPKPLHSQAFICEEIDDTTPCSTSCHPRELFEYNKGEDLWFTKINRHTDEKLQNSTNCQLLNPLFDWLDSELKAQLQRHDQTLTIDGRIHLSSNSKHCQIKGAEHHGNHIWFQIDTNRRTVYQRCYDADCKKKKCFLPDGMNSDQTTTGKKVISVPSSCWSLWDQEWNKYEPYISVNHTEVGSVAKTSNKKIKLNSYQGQDPDVYYVNDGQYGRRANHTNYAPVQAWVVAQWLLSLNKGQVLSYIAKEYCYQAIRGTNNKALQWFISDGLNF